MSRARDLSRLSSPAVFSVDATDASNNKVGVGSTTPTAKLNVAGIVSATSFFGDGSNLEGVASAGLGTALGENDPLAVVYYTDNVLNITDTTTITVPTGSDIAYTQYAEVAVADTKDLIVADGDDFVPDILGLSTEGITPLGSSGGRIRADLFTNHAGTGAPTFQTGVVVTGVATATTFSGALSGNATSATNAQGLTGSPNITVGSVTGTTGSFSGSVSIGGTLTYEDVTNVDSVGIVTTRTGTDLQGFKVEEGKQDGSTSLNGEFDFLLENGHVQRFSAATGGNYFPDFKVSSTKSLSSIMDVGDAVSVMLMVASSSHYCTTGIKIDNSTSNLDIDWTGGAAPAAANGSGFDIYSFTIIKTASTPAYHIIGSAVGAA